MKALGIILGIITFVAIVFGISGLIFWGIGTFTMWAFKISFTWTYWHGLAVAFITWVLSGRFKITIKKD